MIWYDKCLYVTMSKREELMEMRKQSLPSMTTFSPWDSLSKLSFSSRHTARVFSEGTETDEAYENGGGEVKSMR